MIAVPCASADNNTTDPAHYLTHADHLAGPRDMSAYNPTVKPVPLRTMNETTARLYPNVTICGKEGWLARISCMFPFIGCGKSLTVMIVYNVNTSHPDQPGPVVAYGLSGWPMRNPLYVIPAGKSDIFQSFKFFTGMFT